jgi:hypothetical protein
MKHEDLFVCCECGERAEEALYCSGCGEGPLCEEHYSHHEIVTSTQRASQAEENDT